MKRFIALSCLMVIGLTCLFAAPFGIEFGWTVNDLKENNIPYFDYAGEGYVALEPPFEYWAMPNYFADYTQDGIYCVSCFTDPITTPSDGTELWSYYNAIVKEFCASYGLPYIICDYYSDENAKKPSNFMMGLMGGNIRILTVWFIDEYAILLDMYAADQTTGDICCEIWQYKNIMSYFTDLQEDYGAFFPQTKADIPWF